MQRNTYEIPKKESVKSYDQLAATIKRLNEETEKQNRNVDALEAEVEAAPEAELLALEAADDAAPLAADDAAPLAALAAADAA